MAAYSAFYRAQGLVEASDWQVLVLAGSLGVRPLPSDRITVSGVTFTAQSVSADPADAMWTVQERM